jgi:heme-degrading monooxygenase HmoA
VNPDRQPGYAYIWEFFVRPGSEDEFVRHYGPDGTWAELFRRAPGYLGTLLLRDHEERSRFVTVDSWESVDALAAFRREFAAGFTKLDERCEQLTTRENALGTYELPRGGD